MAALSAVAALQGSPRAVWAQELFVTNFSNDSVTVHLRTASGNVAPLRTLQGAETKLLVPAGIAVDTVNNEIVVANLGDPPTQLASITVYSRTASGAAGPLRIISGGETLLNLPVGIAVDPRNNEVLVANTHSITVYGRLASGNVKPLRKIGGPVTRQFVGIAVDPEHNEVLVTSLGDNSRDGAVTVYRRTDSGEDVVPLRTLSGLATHLVNPLGIAVDPGNNEVLVTNLGDDANGPAVTVYSRTAEGNVGPLRTLSGGATGLVGPRGLAVDTVNNEVVVANLGDSAIDDAVTVYSRVANGNFGPVRPPLSGAATGLSGPAFVAVNPRVVCPTALDFGFFDIDFSGGEYVDCFRELLRGSEISDGPDVGDTGHVAVNFMGATGSAPAPWVTVLDATPLNPDRGPTFDAGTLCADVLVVPFNNTKGAGVVSLLNEGPGKKGLALILHEAGNTDTLLLATVDGDPAKKGRTTTLASKSLKGKISGNVWYRLIMKIDPPVGSAAKWTVTGKVCDAHGSRDPSSPLDTQVPSTVPITDRTLTFSPKDLPAGVTSPGQNGILGSAISGVLSGSVTNFSNDPARCNR